MTQAKADVGRTAHTTGPWSAEGPDQFGDYNIHCGHERAVVAAVISNVRSPEEVEANARLIAAAPDLVKALEAAEEWLSGWASAEPYLTIIRAALSSSRSDQQ
ncbi:MAG: hypothetical protein WC100_12000 [Sterolibacterium sp.]